MENKFSFTFFDGNSNAAIQSSILKNIPQQDYDFMFVSLLDIESLGLIEDAISNAKQKNIPIIFLNVNPANVNIIKTYPKAVVLNTDSMQAGTLQGKMIVDAWNKNKNSIDRNGDNILQYVVIKGQPKGFLSEIRSNYSISTINAAGIKTQELATVNGNWDPTLTQTIVESLFLKYNGKIEAIIANSDSMAIGAVKALQKYGYNNGNKSKTIPVFGIHGIPEAQELIKKGFMAGTVLQDTDELAEAVYSIGMNLISHKTPLEDTSYKFDKTGVIVTIPFHEYKT